MAEWREELSRASFRGVGFEYRGATVERGRRAVVHEYPQRDEPDIEDLGRRARRFGLQIYLLASSLGADYFPARDRLIEALEAEGPGTLVHPYYGSIEVQVDTVRESYSTREGGMVRLDVQFYRAPTPERLRPEAGVSTSDVLVERSTGVQAAMREAFEAIWSASSVPEFVRDGLRLVLDLARIVLGLFQGPADSNNPQLLSDETAGSAAAVPPIANGAAVIEYIQQARGDLADEGLPRCRRVRGFADTLTPVTGTTPSQRAQAERQRVLAEAVEMTGLAAAADVVARTVFRSVDGALAARDELVEWIDERAAVADDDTYEALRQLRTALIEDIQARGAGLPNVLTLTPSRTEPALVIAHRLYGDASVASDIIDRNDIRHPGFVPGGEPLEVLSRV